MTAQKKNLILIFDTNIFLTGIDFNIINEQIYTTPKIIDEVNVIKYKDKNRNIINKLEAAIENGKLILKSPEDKYIHKVKTNSKITGDFKVLSDADISLIALSLELLENLNHEVVLYSNDYSIQNICDYLSIRYSSLFKKGIKKKILFEVYCPNCNITFEPEFLNELCERCGLRLKRRPRKDD